MSGSGAQMGAVRLHEGKYIINLVRISSDLFPNGYACGNGNGSDKSGTDRVSFTPRYLSDPFDVFV